LSIVRSPRPDSHYATYSNAVIRDNRLSYKARGILLELLSRPDNWRVDAKALAASGPDVRDAILSGLKELRDLGYIITYKRHNEKGQFETMSVVYDEPKSGFPTSDKPTSENPTPLEEPKKNNLIPAEKTSAQKLVSLYLENLPKGSIKPTGKQLGGQIKALLAQNTEERLTELIPLVAKSGKPLSTATLMIAQTQLPDKTPTQIPPRYNPLETELLRTQSVPMPDHIKALRGAIKADSGVS